MALDTRGLDNAISATIINEADMRKLGFTDKRVETWYYSTRVGAETSFNLSIPKDGSRLKIDVLDEYFLQPYDYQMILGGNPKHPFALGVKENVEGLMEAFQKEGVIIGYERGMAL